MGSKEVFFSDLSGEMIDDPDQLVSLVVTDHPDLEYPVRLDARPDEVAQIGEKTLKAVVVEIRTPDEDPSRYVIAEREFDKLAKGRTMKEVLADATPYTAAAVVQRRSHNRTATGEPLRNYNDPQWAGLPHKGKIGEAEAAYVRGNLGLVNERRKAAGHVPIDPLNAMDAKRYGLDSTSARQESAVAPGTTPSEDSGSADTEA